MSNEENHHDGLDFESAKEMTIEEAVQKEAELKAGITEDDDVLDKYIKRHRDEVASQKFVSEETDDPTSDGIIGNTEPLDDFIAQQRENFESDTELDSSLTSEASNDDMSVSEPQLTSVEWSKDDNTQPIETGGLPLSDQEGLTSNENHNQSDLVTEESNENQLLFEDEETYRDRKPFYKRFWTWGAAAVLVVAIGGAVYWNRQSHTVKTQTTSKQTSSSSSTSSTTSAKEKNKQFTTLYNSFFADDGQTKPKNDMFSRLGDLKTSLDALEGSSYYSSAKDKYDSLNKQIQAIQAVNSQFGSDAIVDGNRVSATVKAEANFDNITDDTLNTGNASLDTLLREVIADGRSQLANQSSQEASTTVVSSEASSDDSTGTSTEQAQVNEQSSASGTAHTSYGIQDYNDSMLQTNLSRVPINSQAIDDVSNPAWDWNPGVLEKVVAVSQERGYITGDNYILQKVNIINGNGYYNMYKPDGTYLFSINCKTGYFVGNAAGHSDSLDY